MSRRSTSRSALVYGLLAVSALALLVLTPVAWRQWRGHAAGRKALSARSGAERSLAAIGAQMTAVEDRRGLLASQAARNAAGLERLEARLMPLEADSSRLLKLDMLDLAGACGLVVEEMKPVLVDGRSRDPESAGSGASAPPAAQAGAAPIAFLGKLPPGEAYRRPMVSLQCRAEYAQVLGFLSGLKGLRWRVTPVAFDIARANAAPSAPALESVDGETADYAAPVRWAAGSDLLRFTVVLAM